MVIFRRMFSAQGDKQDNCINKYTYSYIYYIMLWITNRIEDMICYKTTKERSIASLGQG